MKESTKCFDPNPGLLISGITDYTHKARLLHMCDTEEKLRYSWDKWDGVGLGNQ